MRRATPEFIRPLPAILLLLLGSACGDDDSNVGTPPAVATVTVAPATGSVQIGQTLQLVAEVKDAGGAILTDRTVSWSTSDAAVAGVSNTGLVTGVAPGQAVITATSEGKSGTATITVTGQSLQDFITGVETGDGTSSAQFIATPAPAAGAGPNLTLATSGTVIPGGSAQVTLTGDQQFSTVVVAVQGATGYYQLALPAATQTTDLLLTLGQSLTGTALNWQFGAGTGTTVGPYTSTPATIVGVGTGDVQVTLSWNTPADVDLHVVDPSGEEIWYGSPQSASGGVLDLDSNAGCETGPQNENITWPSGTAPSGTYLVRVDYWSNCEAASTDYSVTVNVSGQNQQTFTGTFTGEGDQGGPGSGTEITTFTVGTPATARSSGVSVHRMGTISVFPRPGAPRGMKAISR